MPYAVTHILLTIIVVDLFRDYVLTRKQRKHFTIHTLLIAGIGGILPDIDLPIQWILNFFGYNIQLLAHREIFHTLFLAIILLIPGLISWKSKKQQIAMYFFVLSFGAFFT